MEANLVSTKTFPRKCWNMRALFVLLALVIQDSIAGQFKTRNTTDLLKHKYVRIYHPKIAVWNSARRALTTKVKTTPQNLEKKYTLFPVFDSHRRLNIPESNYFPNEYLPERRSQVRKFLSGYKTMLSRSKRSADSVLPKNSTAKKSPASSTYSVTRTSSSIQSLSSIKMKPSIASTTKALHTTKNAIKKMSMAKITVNNVKRNLKPRKPNKLKATRQNKAKRIAKGRNKLRKGRGKAKKLKKRPNKRLRKSKPKGKLAKKANINRKRKTARSQNKRNRASFKKGFNKKPKIHVDKTASKLKQTEHKIKVSDKLPLAGIRRRSGQNPRRVKEMVGVMKVSGQQPKKIKSVVKIKGRQRTKKPVKTISGRKELPKLTEEQLARYSQNIPTLSTARNF